MNGALWGTLFQHFPEAAKGGVGCLGRWWVPIIKRVPMSLNSHVAGVLPVWGAAGPSLQSNLASLCAFYKLVKPGCQVGARSSVVTFTGRQASPQIPTLRSPSWGILVILNAICVIWWVGQGEEGRCRGFGNSSVT